LNKTSPRRGGETAPRSGYCGEYGALYAQVEAAKAASPWEKPRALCDIELCVFPSTAQSSQYTRARAVR